MDEKLHEAIDFFEQAAVATGETAVVLMEKGR